MEDPIVAEVHATRQKLFAEAGFDLRQYFENARRFCEQNRNGATVPAPGDSHETPEIVRQIPETAGANRHESFR